MFKLNSYHRAPAKCLSAFVCALSLSSVALVGQVKTPTHSRVSYGPEDRQWLNLYLPSESDLRHHESPHIENIYALPKNKHD